jgi:hypothetical protein
MRRECLVASLSLLAMGLAAGAAQADQCDQLHQLAQQTAALGRDPAHIAAAQNYQNAYIACVNSQRAARATPRGNSGGALGNMPGLLGPSDTPNEGGNGGYSPGSQDAARLEQERQARERAEQEQQAERDRQAALEADRRARCAMSNKFGNSSGCGSDARPFKNGNGGSGSRFASALSQPADSIAYDSVRKTACPDGISRSCISDDWRAILTRIKKSGGRIIIPAHPSDPKYYVGVFSSEQYERIGRGEITWQAAWLENLDVALKRTFEEVDRISDAEAVKAAERMMQEAAN